MTRDLRDFLDQVAELGELRTVDGASWDLEVGAIGETSPYAVLFDRFPGYPVGYRLLVGMVGSLPRWLRAVNLSTAARGNQLAKEWKERLLAFEPLPPRWVEEGPVLENVLTGQQVDVLRFPAPKLHPEDGGRYIGTADAVITRELETGRVNMATLRLQVHDKDVLGLNIDHGKDTAAIVQDYHARGLPCPVVAVLGVDPWLFTAASSYMAHPGVVSEYDFAGWLRGEPYEVFPGRFTGLPVPARAEVVVEGEVPPGETRLEGPFAEWTGYSEAAHAYIIRVKAIYHRNDPIITAASPSGATRRPQHGGFTADPRAASLLWLQMEQAGARGIAGVAVYSRFFQVVAIRNRYAGQARQVGHLAAQVRAGAYLGRYVVVVDEDIDPYNLDQVIWALCRRADPERAIDIVRYCWSARMDSVVPPSEEIAGIPAAPAYSSRCIVDACRPVEWDPRWKRPAEFSPELLEGILRRYGDDLFPKVEGKR